MAVRKALLDTGPLVAYLDRSDAEHEKVATALDPFTGTLYTTSAVITEAMYLLKDAGSGPRRLVEFVQSVGVQIFDCTQPKQLFSAVRLIEKYADTPMDFADATLVLLAEEVKTQQVFTLDRRGFRTFRTAAGKSFEVLPRR